MPFSRALCAIIISRPSGGYFQIPCLNYEIAPARPMRGLGHFLARLFSKQSGSLPDKFSSNGEFEFYGSSARGETRGYAGGVFTRGRRQSIEQVVKNSRSSEL
jgi:hypothetical protein